MCGIVVMLAKQTHKQVSVELLEQMKAAMKHRGPDGGGTYIRDGIQMGMVRLSIVDQETGNQPILNEDESLCLVCNGEIFNYKELSSELKQKGHTFRTKSDVEVILHLYEEYGTACVQRLEGIFAFALWDQVKGSLLVGRDQVGVKPLYYMETENEFIFSSEMNCLLSENEWLYPINVQALSDYHSYRFVPRDKTIVDCVYKLPPAYTAVVKDGRLNEKRYWNPQVLQTYSQVKRSSEELLLLFEQAVKSQEAPEVKTGLFLSGGLDSSALLALQAKFFQNRPLAFTVGFEKPVQQAEISEYNELEQASQVADYFQTEHRAEKFTAQEVLTLLPKILSDLDEPIADPTAIPLWFVSRMAKEEGCKVVYSGEGLDELFYGYAVYEQAQWLKVMERVPIPARKALLNLTSAWKLPGTGLLRRSLEPMDEWYKGVGGTFTEKEKSELFVDELAKILPKSVIKIDEEVMGQDSTTVLNRMANYDFNMWLPDNTLAKSDKISMAHSLELRVPFLNRHLVEYALQLPDNEKRRGKIGKWVVRKSLQNLLPDEVFNRRKVGFPVPISAWLFGEWRSFAQDILLDPGAKTSEIYKREQIRRLFNVRESGRERAGRLIWTLLTFEMWLQTHPNVYLTQSNVLCLA